MFLYEIADVFNKKSIKYAVVGGYAVALHGAVRGTVDIDLVIELSLESLTAAEAALESIGLKSRIPVNAKEIFNFREEYIRNRNLIAWSFFDSKNPLRQVDILITHDVNKLKTKHIKINHHSLSLIDITALIQMKKESGRPQDLEDIKALMEIQSNEK
ncbi:MAG: hypothetical protein KA715_03065 [Xanthomonadaceae bacterium]|nr:hypothetical protein [Xanthomonadaceae bacterium]